ncbi:MAG: DUF6069 family protein [Pseudoclavibacter sp.]
MTAHPAPGSSPTPKHPFGLLRLVIAAALAAVANLIVFLLAHATGTAITTFGVAMNAYEPVAASLVPLIVAGLILWMLVPRWRRLGSIAPVLGGIAAALTAIAPLALVGGASGLWLAPMHLIAGLAWYLGTRPRRR